MISNKDDICDGADNAVASSFAMSTDAERVSNLKDTTARKISLSEE